MPHLPLPRYCTHQQTPVTNTHEQHPCRCRLPHRIPVSPSPYPLVGRGPSCSTQRQHNNHMRYPTTHRLIFPRRLGLISRSPEPQSLLPHCPSLPSLHRPLRNTVSPLHIRILCPHQYALWKTPPPLSRAHIPSSQRCLWVIRPSQRSPLAPQRRWRGRYKRNAGTTRPSKTIPEGGRKRAIRGNDASRSVWDVAEILGLWQEQLGWMFWSSICSCGLRWSEWQDWLLMITMSWTRIPNCFNYCKSLREFTTWFKGILGYWDTSITKANENP